MAVLVILGAGAPVARAVQPTTDDDQRIQSLREDVRLMIEQARDKVFPALVNINVVTVNYWGGKERKGQSVGSGTIISPDGHVVTNQHVTDNGRKFTCTLADKQEIPAELIGEDPLTDLAILKLDLSRLQSPGTPLSHATFGDSDDVRVGDYVMAMGSPFALSRSVTLGIVSNNERVFGTRDVEEMELERGQRTGLFTTWIQHDALIHPGNSGGPLVNLKGEIIGINELGGSSIGFAIPSNLARTVVDELLKHGEVPRSWVGVSFKPIEKTGLDKGVLVNSVVKDGPADKAGLRPGDVILRIDGKPITIRFAEEVPPLMKWIADFAIGSNLKIAYDRDGEIGEATILTEKLEKDRGDEAAFRAFGLTAEVITGKMAREMRLDHTRGVRVSSVRSGGPAELAEPALNYGDIIRRVDGVAIEDLAHFIRVYEDIMQRDPLPENLLIEFDRGGKNHLTLLDPNPDDDEDPPREVPKAWIGIATQPVLEKLASHMGRPEAQGFRITRVYPRTRAVTADLQVGDIVVALNGEPVRPQGMQDAGLFARKVRRLDIGDSATLSVMRGDEPLDVEVPLERTRITRSEARRDKNEDFELTVRELTFFDRDDNRWDNSVKGVIVEQVESAGWAGLGGIRSSDLIQRINDMPVRGLKSYRRVMKKVTEEKPERVEVLVLRGVQTRFQFLEPDWAPEIKDAPEQAENNDEN